jgi:hypothetical protein
MLQAGLVRLNEWLLTGHCSINGASYETAAQSVQQLYIAMRALEPE